MPSATQFGRRGVVAPTTPMRPVYRAPPPATPPAAPPATPRAASPSDSPLGLILDLLFGFEGRLQRSLYRLCRFAWYVVVLLVVYGLKAALPAAKDNPAELAALAVAAAVVPVLVIWTTLAMQVKRWHDRDKSAVWLFVGFIPIVGQIWVLVECSFLEGTQGPNRFGPSPKGDPTAVFAEVAAS